MPLKLLVDMNLSPLTVRNVVASGWDCVRVSDLVRADISDHDILELARNQNRVIVTQDLDFSTLLALSGFDRPSLITFRLSVPTPEIVTRRLLDVLVSYESALADGCAITVDDRLVRMRRLPIR
jgi:predicted nuclease of predicted toxin-antitoxin system